MNGNNKKICQAKTNHKRAEIAKLMSDKVDFNVICQTREPLQNDKRNEIKT